MMNGTTVLYNGVTMRNVVTRQWDSEVSYDGSDTNKLYTRRTLEFEGIIHALVDAATVVAPAATPADAVGAYQAIHKRLSVPRQDLQVYFEGNLVLQVLGQGLGQCAVPNSATDYNLTRADRDQANGPKPRRISLVHICSNTVFRLKFQIEVCTSDCDTLLTDNLKLLLSNSWSVSEAMDSNFYVTRTISGRLVLSSLRVPAHAFKYLTFPTLEAGFKRTSITYEVAANGLEVDYTVTDEQVKWAAPYPATNISGSHTLATADGVNFGTRFSLRLEGPPHVHTRDLLRLAFKVMDQRIKFVNKIAALGNKDSAGAGDAAILDSFSITETIGKENVIDLFVELRELPVDQMTFLANMSANVFGKPYTDSKSGYDPQVSPVPAVYGYQPWTGAPRNPTALFLLHPRLMDPCCGDKGLGGLSTPPRPPGEPEEAKKPKVKVKTVKSLEEKVAKNFDPKAATAIYTIARISNVYTRDPLRVGCPIAGSDAPAASTSAVASSSAAEADTVKYFNLTGTKGAGKRVITCEFERVGKAPDMPNPKDSYAEAGIKGTLLDFTIEGRPPCLSPDGYQRIYYASATYVYGLNRPVREDEKYRLGVLPFTNFKPGDAVAQLDAKSMFANPKLDV